MTLQQALYTTDRIPLLPTAIVSTLGPAGAAFLEASVDVRGLTPLAEAVYAAVLCQEEVAFATEEDQERGIADLEPSYQAFDRAYGFEFLERQCQKLKLPPLPDLKARPVVSDVPSLVLAGSLDPVTPPEYGRSVADDLARSQTFEFPSVGHGVLRARTPGKPPRCAMQLAAAFLDDPTATLDASRIDDLPRLPF